MGQSRPHPEGAEPKVREILGFPTSYAYILCRINTKFDMVTQHVRRGLVLVVNLNPSPP